MKLSLHNLNISKSKNLQNIINKDFFINLFEKQTFFKPILDKKYFDKYDFKKLSNKKNIVHVFGMGGSSLSSKMLMQFIDPYALDQKLFIYDNPYDEVIKKKLTNHKITNFDKFIFISKSGKTVETKYFLEYVINFFNNKIKFKNFIFITENTNNYLNNFAKKKKIKCFEHDSNIGGRFSLFSITGLLPLAVMGYPINKIINESKKSFYEFKKNRYKIGSHLVNFYSSQNKINSNLYIGLSYDQKISSLNEWYRQIFAESLGKNKKSITYISSLGPIDQHSQFQLYIDGPNDKSFIFFKLLKKNKAKSILENLEDGAIQTLKINKKSVNIISINDNLRDYLKLIIILIFDIFLRSKIENINFLDQPAVEKLKNNTKV